MLYELTVQDIFRYFADVGALTGGQFVSLFIPSLALIVLLHMVSRLIRKHAVDTIGVKGYLLVFGWLGVTVHEFGHLIFSVIFFQLVTDVKFFQMPQSTDGTLGWVERGTTSSNFKIGSFFVGIGPALLGSVLIYFAGKWLLGDQALLSLQFPTINITTFSSFENLKTFAYEIIQMVVFAFRFFFLRPEGIDWRFIIFLYIACSIGSSLALSSPDILIALPGFATIFVALFVLNALTLWMGMLIPDTIGQLIDASRSLYGMLLFVLMMNVFIATMIMVISVLASTVRAIFRR